MTVPSIQNSSQQVAVLDHKSVNRKLQEVGDWINSNPGVVERRGWSSYGWDDDRKCHVSIDYSYWVKRWIAEDEATIASDGYKRAIATLAPLAAPPPVDWVSEQIMTLIASKPFGHTLDDHYPKILIGFIGDMDPPPSTAAMMVAFREMILNPEKNGPDVGTAVLCIEEAEKRFQAKYGRLLQLEDRCRRDVALLPELINKEQKKREATILEHKRLKQYEAEKKREEEEKKKREAEQWRKTQEFLAQWSAERARKSRESDQLEAMFRKALDEAQQAYAADPSDEKREFIGVLEHEMHRHGFRTPMPRGLVMAPVMAPLVPEDIHEDAQ
jgi:hypothetical protein